MFCPDFVQDSSVILSVPSVLTPHTFWCACRELESFPSGEKNIGLNGLKCGLFIALEFLRCFKINLGLKFCLKLLNFCSLKVNVIALNVTWCVPCNCM